MILWQSDFSAGEVSERAGARADLPFYGRAASELKNVFVMPEGGITRVPGTEYAATLGNDGRPLRLLPFQKSDEDSVVVVLRAGFLTLYDGLTMAPVMVDGAPVSLAHPYADEDLRDLYVWQSADVMWITSKSGRYQPRTLIRFDDGTWELRTYRAVGGPFQTPNGNPIKNVTPLNVVGTFNLIAPSGTFQPGSEGSLVRVFQPYSGRPYEAWKAEEALEGGESRIHDGRVYKAVGAGDASRSPPVHEEGTVEDGGGDIAWEYLHDLSGIVEVKTVLQDTVAEVEAVERLPQSGASNVWALGHFSDANGWPLVGGIFQGRLYFAGSPSFPDTLWGSRVDGFGIDQADFKQGAGGGEVLDDDAVVRTLNDTMVNRISSFLAGEQIMLFHGGGLVRVTGPSLNEPITPAGASASRPPAPPGAYFHCDAIEAGARSVYASRGGRELMTVDPATFGYDTLTILRRDIGAASRFQRLRYAFEEVRRLFILREDGRLFCCTYDEERQMRAFVTLTMGGRLGVLEPKVEDIVVLPDGEGRERLVLAVSRTINGQTVTTLERMAPDFEGERQRADEAIFADACVAVDRWNSDPAVTVRLPEGSATDRDAVVTLEWTGRVPEPADVGRTLILRAPFAEAFDGEVRCEVLAIGATSHSVRLDTTFEDSLVGRELSGWALAAASLDGLDHLEGETVGVYADGFDLGDQVVSGGAVTLERPAARIVAGYRKAWAGTSLDILASTTLPAQGIGKGTVKDVAEVYVEVQYAGAGEGLTQVITDERAYPAEGIKLRALDDPLSAVPPLRSGTERINVASRHGRTLKLKVFGNGMGPFSLLGMGAET